MSSLQNANAHFYIFTVDVDGQCHLVENALCRLSMLLTLSTSNLTAFYIMPQEQIVSIQFTSLKGVYPTCQLSFFFFLSIRPSPGLLPFLGPLEAVHESYT